MIAPIALYGMFADAPLDDDLVSFRPAPALTVLSQRLDGSRPQVDVVANPRWSLRTGGPTGRRSTRPRPGSRTDRRSPAGGASTRAAARRSAGAPTGEVPPGCTKIEDAEKAGCCIVQNMVLAGAGFAAPERLRHLSRPSGGRSRAATPRRARPSSQSASIRPAPALATTG